MPRPSADPRTLLASRRGRVAALALVVAIAAAVALGTLGPSPPTPDPAGRPPPRSASAPLPPVAGPAELLADRLDRLPYVVRDLPDPPSVDAVAAWDAATIRSAQPLVTMIQASFAGMRVAAGGEAAVVALRDQLLGVRFPGLPEDSGASLAAALDALAGDPRNADRLSNAAVALFASGVLLDLDPLGPDDGTSEARVVASTQLLRAVDARFPDTRSVLLNLAYLRSTVPLPGEDPEYDGARYARRLLELDSGDVTARVLLAEIEGRDALDRDGVGRAEAAVQPLLASPGTAPLGSAAIGDARLAAALIRRPEAPAEARRLAAVAIEAYDAALASVADPGLYAGRATALDLLGDHEAAAVAQGRALQLAPDSLELRLGLMRLRDHAGDVDGAWSAGGQVFGLAGASWDAPVASLRFGPSPVGFHVLGDPGNLALSMGSDRDHLPVTIRPQGGGYVVVELIPPTPDPRRDHRLRTAPALVAAAELAMDAAVGRGDEDGVASVVGTASRAIPFQTDGLSAYAAFGAARIVAAGTVTQEDLAVDDASAVLLVAERVLRQLGRFEEAADVCDTAAGAVEEAGGAAFWRADLLRCAGESAWHAGDRLRAAAGLAAARDLSDEGFGPDAWLRILAAEGAAGAGHLGEARDGFRLAAASDDGSGDASAGRLRAVAALRLGDVLLEAGDPVSAAASYDLALAAIEANRLARAASYWEQATSLLDIRALQQVARNNRGIATLRSLQPDLDTAPDCFSEDFRPRCEAALADFRAAAASDPGNGVYRMNEAWASRLLGDRPGSRAAFDAAVSLDPTLFPAFNDLGVVLAEEGDRDGARRAFESAVAANPDYALGWWNLGVLRLGDLPIGPAAGQAALARAVRLDASLRAAPMAFRLDERTYRFGFEAGGSLSPAQPIGRGFSVAAVVLGLAATAGALAQFHGTLMAQVAAVVSAGVTGSADRVARALDWRRRRRALRRRLPDRFRAWLPWLLVAPVLAIVTAWQTLAGGGPAAVGVFVLAIFGAAVAFAVHAAGHLLAARLAGARLLPDQWTPGAALAMLLLPLGAASGPFPAERLRVPHAARGRTWLLHLAGPAANALAFVVAYGLWLLEPIPVLRLLGQVQLAAIAYALLPTPPLDGAAIAARSAPGLAVAGLGVALVSAAFALGLL